MRSGAVVSFWRIGALFASQQKRKFSVCEIESQGRFVCLSACLSCLSVLSVCLPVCLSVSVCLSVCLSLSIRILYTRPPHPLCTRPYRTTHSQYHIKCTVSHTIPYRNPAVPCPTKPYCTTYQIMPYNTVPIPCHKMPYHNRCPHI